MARGTITDKLADVVQVLQFAHKTGLLSVSRELANRSVEKGTIRFQNGQIVDASLEPLKGIEALNTLVTWKTCYFVFQPSADPSIPAPVSAAPRTSPIQNDTDYSHGREPPHFPKMHTIPSHVRPASEVLPYFNRSGLTRAHRQLFLLINGKRNVQELMRLMGYQPEEINALLADLEQVNLIYQ